MMRTVLIILSPEECQEELKKGAKRNTKIGLRRFYRRRENGKQFWKKENLENWKNRERINVKCREVQITFVFETTLAITILIVISRFTLISSSLNGK